MNEAKWKPSKLQYLLARGYVRSTCTTATIVAAVAARQIGPSLAAMRDVSFLFYYVAAIVLIWPLGWFLGAFCVWPFVMALTNKLNGAPFQNGDLIHILVGPHRDRVAHIYDVWPTRNQARVELGEKEKKAVTDVFDYTDICRERSA